MVFHFLRFRFQDAPKMWQETPKISQVGHKMNHNSFQDEVKMAKMSQDRLLDGTKIGQDGAKLGQDAAKMTQDSA